MSRVVVALILAPVVLALTYLSGWPFLVMVCVFSTLVVFEAAKVIKKTGSKPEILLLVPANLAIQIAVYFQYWKLIPFVVFAFISILFIIEIIKGNITGASGRIGANLVALAIGSLLAFLTVIEFVGATPGEKAPGWRLLFTLFSGVWSFDIFSYYGGMLAGKHKLVPKVSPGKTWEGLIIGFILGLAVTITVGLFLIIVNRDVFPNFDLVRLIAGGIVIIGASLVGDLSESVLKRDANMKDSGKILIGHGGVLDRLDSILFAAPAFYFFLEKVVLP